MHLIQLSSLLIVYLACFPDHYLVNPKTTEFSDTNLSVHQNAITQAHDGKDGHSVECSSSEGTVPFPGFSDPNNKSVKYGAESPPVSDPQISMPTDNADDINRNSHLNQLVSPTSKLGSAVVKEQLQLLALVQTFPPSHAYRSNISYYPHTNIAVS